MELSESLSSNAGLSVGNLNATNATALASIGFPISASRPYAFKHNCTHHNPLCPHRPHADHRSDHQPHLRHLVYPGQPLGRGLDRYVLDRAAQRLFLSARVLTLRPVGTGTVLDLEGTYITRDIISAPCTLSCLTY